MANQKPIVVNLAAQRGTPGEKWIDVAVIRGLPPGHVIDWRFTGALPDLRHAENELDGEDADASAFNVSLGAINWLRYSLGFPGVTLSPERLHLLTEADYLKAAGPGTNGAISSGGHAYIAYRDRLHLWRDITHEMSHLLGFWLQEAIVELVGRDYRLLDLGLTRLGLDLYIGGKRLGHGLNEVAAEMTANYSRQALVKQLPWLLNEEQRHELLSKCYYLHHTRMVLALCDQLVARKILKRPRGLLAHDYFGGTNRFVQAVSRFVPRDELLAVTDQDASAVAFMERHGLV